jgi:hypothetical protein
MALGIVVTVGKINLFILPPTMNSTNHRARPSSPSHQSLQRHALHPDPRASPFAAVDHDLRGELLSQFLLLVLSPFFLPRIAA